MYRCALWRWLMQNYGRRNGKEYIEGRHVTPNITISEQFSLSVVSHSTGLVADVSLEFRDLFRELFLLVLQLPDLPSQLARPKVGGADLVHLLVSRLEIRLHQTIQMKN